MSCGVNTRLEQFDKKKKIYGNKMITDLRTGALGIRIKSRA